MLKLWLEAISYARCICIQSASSNHHTMSFIELSVLVWSARTSVSAPSISETIASTAELGHGILVVSQQHGNRHAEGIKLIHHGEHI